MFQEKWERARSFMAMKNIVHQPLPCLVPEGLCEGVARLGWPVSSAGDRSWGETLPWTQALGC